MSKIRFVKAEPENSDIIEELKDSVDNTDENDHQHQSPFEREKKRDSKIRIYSKQNNVKFVQEVKPVQPEVRRKSHSSSRVMNAIDIVQRLVGSKHPESKQLAEDLYSELTKQLLMSKSPHQIPLKIDSWKLLPSQAYVDELKLNPCLVQKHASNSLLLPQGIQANKSLPALRTNGTTTTEYFNKIEVANRIQHDLKLRSTSKDSYMPYPSSVKALLSQPNYLSNITQRLEQEKEQSYCGSKVGQAQRSFKSVILNSWNTQSSGFMDARQKRQMNVKMVVQQQRVINNYKRNFSQNKKRGSFLPKNFSTDGTVINLQLDETYGVNLAQTKESKISRKQSMLIQPTQDPHTLRGTSDEGLNSQFQSQAELTKLKKMTAELMERPDTDEGTSRPPKMAYENNPALAKQKSHSQHHLNFGTKNIGRSLQIQQYTKGASKSIFTKKKIGKKQSDLAYSFSSSQPTDLLKASDQNSTQYFIK